MSAQFPTGTTTNPGHLYTPSFPRLWAAPGAKCEHAQYRIDRITLYCAKAKGHDGNHLHDVHPVHQVGALGDKARAEREASLRARFEVR